MKKHIRIVVCGHPNSGKTLLISKITGALLKVGNFPGTTVDKQEVSVKHKGTAITFIDLPGFYSSEPFSEDEEISIDFVKKHKREYDAVLCVGNPKRMRQALVFIQTMRELTTKPIIVAINMMDDAARCGIKIDNQKIEYKTGHRLIPVDAHSGSNTSDLLDVIVSSYLEDHRIDFDLESLEAESMTQDKPLFCCTDRSAIIDRIILNKFFAVPVLFCTMLLMFALTFWIGQIPSEIIEQGGIDLAQRVGSYLPKNLLHMIFFDGIIPGVVAAVSFLPKIVILFVCVSFLERSGYMSRISFITDGILRSFGITGRSAVPLISGFGCSIPAYMSTRILSNKRQKIATMVAIGFVPCSAKMIVLVMLTSAFFAPKVAPFVMITLYFVGLSVGLITARIASILLRNKKDSLCDTMMMELPPYRMPQLSLIKHDIVPRAKSYLKDTATKIAIISFMMWLCCNLPYNPFDDKYWEAKRIIHSESDIFKTAESKKYMLENSIVGKIGQTGEVLFAPIGFDWKINVCLLAATAAKEIAIGTLGVLYQPNSDPDGDNGLIAKRIQREVPFASGLSFMVFMLIYTPCLSALATFARESQSKKYTAIVALFTTCLAWGLSWVAYKIAMFL